MPPVTVVLFRERSGAVPALEWLAALDEPSRDKCIVRLEHLAEVGHAIRRPDSEPLRSDIHELRASHMGVHHRLLYFFAPGTGVAVLSHGLAKLRRVRPEAIERAVAHRRAFERDPLAHVHHAGPSPEEGQEALASTRPGAGRSAASGREPSPPGAPGIVLPAGADAIELLHRRYDGKRPERAAALEAARQGAHIARVLYELRTRADLSQRHLARIVRTSPSVICRLEADEYEGHAFTLLHRIATALGHRLDVRFVPWSGEDA